MAKTTPVQTRTTKTASGRLRMSVVGTLLAATGAIAYGLTAVFDRAFAVAGFPAATVVGYRFGGAGVVLAVVIAVLRKPWLPARRERIKTALISLLGFYATAQLFFAALQQGTVGMAALLFYAFPATVLIGDIALGARPSRVSVVALLLAVTGTSIVAVAGGDTAISGLGIVFALGAAVTYGLGLLASGYGITDTDPVTKSAWMTIGVGAAALVQGAVTGTLVSPAGYWPWFVANASASAATFGFIFASMNYVSATRVSVVMTLEVVSAIVLGWLFLDEAMGVVQLIGGAVILAAAVIIALSGPEPVPEKPRRDAGR